MLLLASISFLKARETMNMLASVKAQALEPAKIEALIHLVNDDRGYYSSGRPGNQVRPFFEPVRGLSPFRW